eukprot:c47630_g1_i1 orf=180-548(+)
MVLDSAVIYGGEMFATAAKLLAKRATPKARFLEPPGSGEEAHQYAKIIHNVLIQNGPLSFQQCWTQCQSAGFRSKRHLKMILRWMKENERVRLVCRHLNEIQGRKGESEFVYAPFYGNPTVS